MRFEVYADSGGHHRWRLTAGNGQKVAASGEAFASRSNADRAARGFKAGAASATYSVWDTAGKWYWHAAAANGETIATGGQPFVSRYDAQRAADNVRDHAGDATGP